MTPCPTCHHEARYHDDGRCWFVSHEVEPCPCPVMTGAWRDYWP